MAPLLGAMGELEREHLRRARRRLAACGLHPRMRHVRVVHAPWFFRLPGLRRFAGYEIGPLILVERPLDAVSNDLVTHELCHVWQDQQRRAYMWASYLWQGYRDNEHEVQARDVAARTRGVA